MNLAHTARLFFSSFLPKANLMAPVVDLVIRLWVAWVFFKSGLTKIANMDTTVFLFENEYNVPFLPPAVAAYVGTYVELIVPTLLALGLAGRLSAGVLFLFNIVAVVAYYGTLKGTAGMDQHTVWGLMLLVTLVYGPGKLSVDHLIKKIVKS